MDGEKDKLKGKGNEMIGNAKDEMGHATGNEDMHAEGHTQELKGKGQGMMGEMKDKAEDVKDKMS